MKRIALMKGDSWNRLLDGISGVGRADQPRSQMIRLTFCKDKLEVTAVGLNSYMIYSVKSDCLDVFEEMDVVIKKPPLRTTAEDFVTIGLLEDAKQFFIEYAVYGAVFKTAIQTVDWKQVEIFEKTKQAPHISISFNLNYMLKILNSLKKGRSNREIDLNPVKMQISGEISPIVVSMGDANQRLILPVRNRDTNAESIESVVQRTVSQAVLPKPSHKTVLCPRCKKELRFLSFKTSDVGNVKYCPYCGQRIDIHSTQEV